MKFIQSIACAFLVSIVISACGQTSKHLKTETFKVWGNCEMCEKRIEKAAKIKGVTTVDWSPETKEMTLNYDTTLTNPEMVQKVIAAAGYDTPLAKADDKAYANLPECCQYDRKPITN